MASPKNAKENSGVKPKEYAPPTGRRPSCTPTTNNKMMASANGGTLEKNSDPMKAPRSSQPPLNAASCSEQVADDPADQDRRKHDRETPGQRLRDQGVDRGWVLRERGAEIALEHIADIDEELLPQRLVEAELLHVVLVDLLQLFAPGAPTPGKLADDGVDRVARDEAREEEVQQQGDEEDHEGPCHFASEVFR